MARLYRRTSSKPGDPFAPDTLKFLLNGNLVEVENESPSRTILDYLRNQAGLCGTRDGCATGACGACTVSIGEIHGKQLIYQCVNSCISLLPSLHGKHLVTVEGLNQNGKLHPVQSALVAAHASQCGYCMPGFVMSLFTMSRNSGDKVSVNRINDELSGHLCRCTGYRPVTSAARKLLKRKNLARFGFDDQVIFQKLKRIGLKSSRKFKGGKWTYHAPVSPEELAVLVQDHPRAKLVAGATDVGVELTSQKFASRRLISLERIPALRQVRVGKDMITLGAGVTLTESRDVLSKEYPDLGDLIRKFGSPQIRNRATLAGNIASGSPRADLVPALIALDAGITLRVGHYRRHLQLEDFYTGPGKLNLKKGEFIESIQLPRANTYSTYHVYKLSKRHDQDTASLCGAFYVLLDAENRVGKIRISFAGLGLVPKRATNTEQALINQPWNLSSVRQAALNIDSDFDPSSSCRGSREYLLLAAKNVMTRFFLECGPGSVDTRLYGVNDD